MALLQFHRRGVFSIVAFATPLLLSIGIAMVGLGVDDFKGDWTFWMLTGVGAVVLLGASLSVLFSARETKRAEFRVHITKLVKDRRGGSKLPLEEIKYIHGAATFNGWFLDIRDEPSLWPQQGVTRGASGPGHPPNNPL